MSKSKSPLQNVNIADFSWSVVGPTMTTMLAYYGAEVVKVESRYTPEISRVSSPYKDGITGINRSVYFNRANVNKYSLHLNLNHPKGQEVARKLAAWADVVVDSFTPGSAAKRGISYNDLKQINEDIIVLSTSSQGQTGPYSRHPGYGFQLVALCGFTELIGWPDGGPSLPPAVYTDFIAPWFGISAILAALEFRDRTGLGQNIDLSQVETGLQMLTLPILSYSANSYIWQRTGNRSLTYAPHGAYRCLGDDRWCVISVTTEEEWRAFCRVLNNPDWTLDAKFATVLSRKQNEDELDRLVEEWIISFTAEEVMTRLQMAGVPAGVVKNNKDMWFDPQLKHRGHFKVVTHPEIGEHSCELPSIRLSECPAEVRRPAPCLGEHSEFVCCHLLGMSDTEFAHLMSEGVFE